MQRLRGLLAGPHAFPCRRTWERRLAALPECLPARIACLGAFLLVRLQPFAVCGRAVAIDSTCLRAWGRPWHQKDKQSGHLPHSRIDTQAGWTKSGWHGWVYGWKLHLVCTVAEVWIPLAAELTAADVADNVMAARLLRQLPGLPPFLLGDSQYNTQALRQQCQQAGCILVASRRSQNRVTNPAGLEVRRVFHALRSLTMETFNAQFKGIFAPCEQVPTRGQANTARLVLGAVLVYQMALWYRAWHKQPLRAGLKPFLRAA